MIDLSPPSAPTVNELLSANSTPAITGTVPTDNNFLLSVQVNSVLYASGDGQLVDSGNGIWTLVIPPADALEAIADQLETQIDRDGDGIRNYLDADADNDGISDINERSIAVIVNQLDGRVAETAELGANGLADAYETEPDSGTSLAVIDTDGDQLADYLDHDSDGDGISDVVENGHADSDGDAMRNDGLVVTSLDFDRDKIPNYRDLDSDQDGIPDVLERPALDSNGDGKTDNLIDDDNNGLADSVSGQLAAGLAQDLDGDGAANYLDIDSDGDRRLDITESGGTDADNNGIHDSFVDINGNAVDDAVDVLVTMGSDADGDLIDDRFDSSFVNSSDSDSDGIIDTHDADADGNGLVDLLDDVVLQLPDLNRDGRIDAYEAVTPETAAVLRTGVGTLGGGCVMHSMISIDENARIDFMFFWMLLGALVGVQRKRVSAKCSPCRSSW